MYKNLYVLNLNFKKKRVVLIIIVNQGFVLNYS